MLYYFMYGRFTDESTCAKALGIISKNVHWSIIEIEI